MSVDFFAVERGFSLDGNAQIIHGTGAPGASGGDPDVVVVSSIYVRSDVVEVYQKHTTGTGADKWKRLVGADESRRIGHTYAIAGEIKVPVGDSDFLVPFYVSLAGSQTGFLVKARHKINSGTSVTCKLQKNDGDITGFTGISVTTTPADTDPTDVALADDDKLALIVTGVSGVPKNLTFTLFIDYSG